MPDSEGRVAELEAELQETREQLEKLQAERERDHRRNRLLGRWGLRLLAGQELRTSSRAWFEKLADLKSPRDLASPESADLVAAITRRILRIGVFGLVVGAFAVLTPLVTLWQSFLIREQNAVIQRQVNRQEVDNRIVRRAQLLATIYEEDCVEAPEAAGGDDAPEEICQPTSHVRARQEAVLAFVEIERSSSSANVDLRGANVGGADFSAADLSAVDLRGTNLSNTNLIRADLSNAQLDGANLSGANLTFANLVNANLADAYLNRTILRLANLKKADLTRADLSHAQLGGAQISRADLTFTILHDTNFIRADLTSTILRSANFGGADLSQANLDGALLIRADFGGAKNLTQDQINGAIGDLETQLPKGLRRPEDWTTVDW